MRNRPVLFQVVATVSPLTTTAPLSHLLSGVGSIFSSFFYFSNHQLLTHDEENFHLMGGAGCYRVAFLPEIRSSIFSKISLQLNFCL